MRRYYGLNTLRNQMMVGFLLVMSVILAVGGGLTYRSSVRLMTDNSEMHMRQTASQAIGRMEALIEQVNTLTLQTATNATVQQLLLKEVNGIMATFRERQNLADAISMAQIFTTDILSIELYTSLYKRIYPLDDRRLSERLNHDWIRLADSNRGKIAWLGIDPADPKSVLAIRRIPLMDRWYSNGGYLVVKINRDYFRLRDTFFSDSREDNILLLLDEDSNVISTSRELAMPDDASMFGGSGNRVELEGKEYMVVRERSAATGWSLIALTPSSPIAEGASALRSAVIVSGIVGCALFLVMAWFLSTLITRPIRQLIATMRSSRLGTLKLNRKRYSNMEMNELNITYNQMVKEINELIRLVYEKELMQSRTELKALQAQIHPHFLFNTLEAFYWSLETKGEEELADLVIAMSKLFRYTITRNQKDEWVTIRDELDHIERYLEITRMRLGERISWNVVCEPEIASESIPKLLLQPIVENAVLHGIENKLGNGHIRITVEKDERDQSIVIAIADDGVGMDAATLSGLMQDSRPEAASAMFGSGYAMENVRRRLQLYYKDSPSGAGIAVDSEEGEGTTVTIRIPQEQGGEHYAV